jgi:5-methylcytosine-specific restriction endonuclease McrA
MPISKEQWKKYPANWKTKIVPRIRKRDQNTCQHCGETGEQLQVAHVNHDETDNRDENLLLLCRPAHLAHDKLQHRDNAAVTRRKKKEARRWNGSPLDQTFLD